MAYILPQLLMETAPRYPEKAAVVFQNDALSYAALDELSNRLAHALKMSGVQRGDRVGIYLNKTIPAIISIFGILKADAVYVPLDPYAPVKRLSYIIKNCGIQCLLSAAYKMEAVAQMLDGESPLRRVILTDVVPFSAAPAGLEVMPWEKVMRAPGTAPELKSIETDLAYILYTSGSTGDPKGVMISHLNAFTFINWAHGMIKVQPEDRVSNHAPLHFDLSIFDIFAAIKAGATLCLVPAETAKFPVKLAEWISQQRISVWYSVPSAWVHMLNHGQMEKVDFSKLRAIIFAGEVFPTKHLRCLMEKIPQADYFNWYGPTETNVITCYQVKSLAPDQNAPVPIGKACANMEVFALDDEGRLVVDAGVEGELYGRGAGVAQGYWGDPAKTGKLFLRNPLQPHYDDRVYRTGDLVKLDAEGNYLYLGRRDHQVKVQGYRIELGEIETALLSHPEVEEAAVVALQNAEQTTFLKAFVVPRNGRELSVIDLKRHCSKHVPKYMIPEMVEIRQTLPKTSTGKTDKKLLMAEGQPQ
ncbi:MAG: amino acid adenylation domain-containing protein [candidate division KSB1 bacterium]|nr:amino acid adenylation domain-containing protein [candidate division KSB1 bacterium]MDZ7369233.1 amino acid adenylation domain-containing protein [candidate division KSB1 bacterium]MDZ7407233.1 amino acid adenylation domain-containing protein [candidate division KSB1 bacterium]